MWYNQGKENNYGFKHGGKGTKLYNIWASMKQRVLNPNNHAYKDYGGRGITICPEWTNDYTKFRDWSLNNGYQEGLFFDRENPNGNYEPSNCRFITKTESSRNKRNTLTVGIANEIRELHIMEGWTQKQLSEKYNVSQSTISLIILNKRWV